MNRSVPPQPSDGAETISRNVSAFQGKIGRTELYILNSSRSEISDTLFADMDGITLTLFSKEHSVSDLSLSNEQSSTSLAFSVEMNELRGGIGQLTSSVELKTQICILDPFNMLATGALTLSDSNQVSPSLTFDLFPSPIAARISYQDLITIHQLGQKLTHLLAKRESFSPKLLGLFPS